MSSEKIASLPRPPSALRDRILSKAREAPSLTAAQVRTRRIGMLVGAILPALVVLAAMGVGPRGRPLALALLVSIGWGAVAVASTAFVFSGSSPLGPPRPALALLAALAPTLELAISAVGMTLYPDTWSGVLAPQKHAICMMLGFAMSAAPLGAMLLHLRGLDPVSPRARGAALGATAGAWGGAGTMLLCPHHGAIHVLVGHVLPVALFALVGAIVGSRVLALESRPLA